MYITEAVPAFVATLTALTAPSGKALVAHGRNRGAEPVFIETAQAQGWQVAEVPRSGLHPGYIAPDVSVLQLSRSAANQ